MTKSYELNIDPRILELLGPSLYTNIYYVLAELIANAYDADAQNVHISIEDERIRIEDDGQGMSYEHGVKQFLNVAAISRSTEDEATTPLGRKKMGRNGVGKIASLSISDQVTVTTVKDGDRSGFILSRVIDDNNQLEAVPEDDIEFEYINDHGTSITMDNPKYSLHKTEKAIKKNLLKMFPIVSRDFRIHIHRGGKTLTLDSYDREIASELGTFMCFGSTSSELKQHVPNQFPEADPPLITSEPAIEIPITMRNNEGTLGEYIVKVEGWIGTYKTTRNRKLAVSDFPDNFISIFANGKIGEFNILPQVGQNRVSDVYVVGQLHADILELTELPDIALSNRQGYKSDDPRYISILEHVRTELLPKIRRRRDQYADLRKKEQEEEKADRQRQKERDLRDSVERFQNEASSKAASSIKSLGSNPTESAIRETVRESIDDAGNLIGIKSKADAGKKKILISHTWADKDLADIIQSMLIYNGAPASDIIHSNSDEQDCRIPIGTNIHEYLRDFFVSSYSAEQISVIFVASEDMGKSWGAICEVGAAWITKKDHSIFSINAYQPKAPLDNLQVWQSSSRDESKSIVVEPMGVDVFCNIIEAVCETWNYPVRDREENRRYLKRFIQVA